MKRKDTQELLDKAKSGDNKAWEELFYQNENLIHKIAWKQLSELNFSQEKKSLMEQDMFQAGWLEFIKALKNYNSKKGTFITYAYSYIEWGIRREKSFLLNSLGLKNAPKLSGQAVSVSIDENDDEKLVFEMAEALNNALTTSHDSVPEGERFSGRQLALQLLAVLKLLTDEDHTLTQEELFSRLGLYRRVKYNNSWMEKSRSTLTEAVKELLAEGSGISYYEKKAGEISNLYYNHPFSSRELDQIIQLVALTDMLSEEEKVQITEKLVSTASLYYKSPFWDGKNLRFDPKAIYGRFSSTGSKGRLQLAENIRVLQNAVNNLYQVRFVFNKINGNGELEPVSDYKHNLSPYHLVVYHDNFYCIGLKNDENRVWHYRVDLMSEIEILSDIEGNPMPIKVCDFSGLPIGNSSWDPEKYMAEHLNMAYDLPEDILIKIRSDSYTIIHDWFSNHYETVNMPCEEGYHIVRVKTSPSMIVHWAMQYGERVEIMDEDIRRKIIEEIEKMKNIYKK